MKALRIGMALGFMLSLLGMVPEARAITVRVRCEVKPDKGLNRVKIQVDAKDLADGNYSVTVPSPNGEAGATSGPQTAVGGEVSFDFDSTAQAGVDADTPISAGFADAGDVVTVTITPGPFPGSDTCKN